MKVYFKDTQTALYLGDCVEVMAKMKENFVDAIVTDPPYGLEFMGKEWDKLGRLEKYREEVTRPEGSPLEGRERSWPQYTSKVNPRCTVCKHYRFSGTPCKCGPQARWDINEGVSMQFWHQAWAEQALRVLKPGGHMLVAGIGRTMHRMMCGIEDAGFEPRDVVMHVFGSGFPKSLDVSKAIDKAAKGFPHGGPNPLSAGHGKYKSSEDPSNPTGSGMGAGPGQFMREQAEKVEEEDKSLTLEAQQWDGWGTALKPAWEIWVLFRKPLSEKNVVENVLRWGVGGINVDESRIATPVTDSERRTSKPGGGRGGMFMPNGDMPAGEGHNPQGRWPANFILNHLPECIDGACAEDCPVRMLDEQSGESRGSGSKHVSSGEGFSKEKYAGAVGRGEKTINTGIRDFGDSGGASRFFYVAKASRSEREEGLLGVIPCTKCGGLETKTHIIDERESNCIRNDHPTVKPVALMEYLIRLITPPGGIVLDPFAGSGSTGVAARRLGMKVVLIEKEEKSMKISLARLMQRDEE